eukprot:10129358-Lingulodinium_polyedra.AAC.1
MLPIIVFPVPVFPVPGICVIGVRAPTLLPPLSHGYRGTRKRAFWTRVGLHNFLHHESDNPG